MSTPLLGLALRAVPEPIGLGDELEDHGPMPELIEHRNCQLFAPEDLLSICEADATRDGHCHTFVEGGAQLEHQLSADR